MKKTLLITAFSLLLLGCSNPFTETKKGISRNTQNQNISQEKKMILVSDFYFEASDRGLTLKIFENEDFSQQLSQKPIESAEITNGILTFVEKTDTQTQTQVFNLESLAEQMNQ